MQSVEVNLQGSDKCVITFIFLHLFILVRSEEEEDDNLDYRESIDTITSNESRSFYLRETIKIEKTPQTLSATPDIPFVQVTAPQNDEDSANQPSMNNLISKSKSLILEITSSVIFHYLDDVVFLFFVPRLVFKLWF